MYLIESDRKYGFENDSQASLKCFLNLSLKMIGRRYRIGMIILPGGGYSSIEEREADPVAMRYAGYGIQCFVLRYSTSGPDRYKKALRQLCESIILLRKNCERWDIDPDRIVLCGFSAGGHLAASVGCYASQLSEWMGNCVRPDALLLGYPVITAGEFAHRESIENCLLSGNGCDRDHVSLENQVGSDMPPVFLWACADDEDVPVQNTVFFAVALAGKKVPFDLRVFHRGGHGGSLGDECTARIEGQINEHYAEWFQASLIWLKEVL